MRQKVRYLDLARGSNCARIAILAAIIGASAGRSHANPPPGYDPNSAESHWYQGARSVEGVNCCSMADGHVVEAQRLEDGNWQVLIRGAWHTVPPSAYLKKDYPPHPAGSAVVWETHVDSNPIRCFAPPVSGN